MFEAIVSKITNVVRTAIRAIDAAARRTAWLAPAAILALLFVIVRW
jgi:hypothetical protein